MAERLWRTLLGTTRSLLFSSPLGDKHWPLSARHAAYLYNRRPHATLEMTTPYENLFHEKPRLDHLRVFGCGAFAHIDEQHRDSKLAPRAHHGLYVGHQEDSPTSAIIFVPESKKLITSGDVTYTEQLDALGKVVINNKLINSVLFDVDEELTRLPADFSHQESVIGIKKILEHAVVYHDGETHGIVKVASSTSPGGGQWVFLHALLHEDSDSDVATRLAAYLRGVRGHTTINRFHPIFTKVDTKHYGGRIQPAYIVSHDAAPGAKEPYQVGYIEPREQGC